MSLTTFARSNPSKPDSSKSDANAPDIIERVSKWSLVVFAGFAGLGALVRMFGPREAGALQRTDQTTLLYLAVAGALLLLHKIRTFSFGQLKFELIEKVRERQVKQEEDIALVIPLLLPKTEKMHLKNLANGTTGRYRGSHALRGELRRLRSMGLISNRPNVKIGDMKDGMEFDLSDYAELTELGKRWASRIRDIEEAAEAGQAPD